MYLGEACRLSPASAFIREKYAAFPITRPMVEIHNFWV
jgi:hypothetical protein